VLAAHADMVSREIANSEKTLFIKILACLVET
jgi:hypothetical protein